MNLEVDQVYQNETNCTGIVTHTVLLFSWREDVLQQQVLVAGTISTAVHKNSLASGEVHDFIQELGDVCGGHVEQLEGIQIND